MPVERDHREPVVAIQPEAGAERIGEPQGALGVLTEGGGVGAVVDRRPRRVPAARNSRE
jgi:hypothetical protein